MAPGHFIREWRKHRGVTMDQLAEKLGVSLAVVSRLERGQQRYNQDLLERAAIALRCSPADLIQRLPASPEAEISRLVEMLGASEKRQLVEVVRLLRGRVEVPASDPVDDEERLIGALLYEPFSVREVKTLLTGDHFTDPVLGAIYDDIKAISSRGEIPDPVIVASGYRPGEHPEFFARGGLAYLAGLVDAAPPININLISRAIYERAVPGAAQARREETSRG
jgi:transcriptional regulator with XRE-family HTH domain